MNDVHEMYLDGYKLRRLFEVPNAAIDSQIDPFSAQDFVRKSKAKNVGECWEESAAMAEKRQQKRGHDPVKEKFEKTFKTDRRGKKIKPQYIKK